MVVNREQTRRRGISEEIYRNHCTNPQGISVYTVLCEETEALDSLQNNTHFSIFSEICCFFLVKHTQNILVAEQNTCSVGKFHTPNFEALLLTSTNYVSKPFNSPNFKFWKGENAAPIIFSGVEVNKHVWRCEQTPTWQGMSSQVSVCSENSVCEHFEVWHLAFRTTPNACYPCTFLCQNRECLSSHTEPVTSSAT